ITLEGEPIDDRRFDHRDDEPAARLGDADVLEQPRGVKRLEGGVDLGGVDALAWRDFEISADGIGFDTAVALDDDRGGALPGLRTRGRWRKRRDAKKSYP